MGIFKQLMLENKDREEVAEALKEKCVEGCWARAGDNEPMCIFCKAELLIRELIERDTPRLEAENRRLKNLVEELEEQLNAHDQEEV
jgi:hypothetical protein